MDIDLDSFLKEIDMKISELEGKQLSDNIDNVEKIQTNIINLQKSIEDIYDECLNEFDTLVGLDEVKNEMKKLINLLIFYKKLNNKISIGDINLNMIFRGNPGTGKTTVARIVGKILYKLGFVSSDKFIETTPRDFIGGFIGQTAIKANKTIQSAKGGVIFIDEAYIFASGFDESNNSYAPEAIAEIIKEMECKKTVFIFSGYSRDMDEFIKMNSGIKSRIGYDIEFPDYTCDELLTIFNNKMKSLGFKLDDDVNDIVCEKIKSKMADRNFGNARMIDNLCDEIVREHASINLKEHDVEKLLLIKGDTIKRIKNNIKGGFGFE